MKPRISRCHVATQAWLALLTLGVLISSAEAENSWKPWLVQELDGFSLQAPPDDLDSEQRNVSEAMADESAVQAAQYWSAGAPNYRWMQELLSRYLKGPPSPLKGRGIALLNVAVYDALVHAERLQGGLQQARPEQMADASLDELSTFGYPSSEAAVASAAAGVLAYLFPEEEGAFKAMADQAAASRVAIGANFPSAVEAGQTLGDYVAMQVIEYARNDKSDTEFTGTRPQGPDKFVGDLFVYPTAGEWTPWVVDSLDDFLPPPPPAIDSPAMQEELAVLRNMERTLPMSILAWVNHSTERAIHWWYERLALSMFESRLDQEPIKAALVYTAVSTANVDAVLACFNAKYTYWTIRPAYLDGSVPTLFPSPPHPSYPAAHSCSTRSLAVAISHYFPETTESLMTASDDAGQSRVIAGIHYPSDIVAGDAIGRDVAKVVLDYADSRLP